MIGIHNSEISTSLIRGFFQDASDGIDLEIVDCAGLSLGQTFNVLGTFVEDVWMKIDDDDIYMLGYKPCSHLFMPNTKLLLRFIQRIVYFI